MDRLHHDAWARRHERRGRPPLLGRYHERFGDHTVQIGRRMAFMATGVSPTTGLSGNLATNDRHSPSPSRWCSASSTGARHVVHCITPNLAMATSEVLTNLGYGAAESIGARIRPDPLYGRIGSCRILIPSGGNWVAPARVWFDFTEFSCQRPGASLA